MSIYDKLLNIQEELKAPKSQYNSFGKYNYRSCEDIQEALKPLLNKYKATIFISDTVELIGNRYYVKATVTFVDCENSTDSPIVVTAYAREEENKKGADASQITGSCSSYARKYALNGMFAIDDNKDSDYTNTGDANKGNATNNTKRNAAAKKNDTTPQTKEKTITPETMKKVNMALSHYKSLAKIETKNLLEHIKKTMDITIDAQMTEEQAEIVIKQLAIWENKLKEKQNA